MIAWAAADGRLLKTLATDGNAGSSEVFGFHRVFGLIAERELPRLRVARELRGLPTGEPSPSWDFKFELDAKNFRARSIQGCQTRSMGSEWVIETPKRTFKIVKSETIPARDFDRAGIPEKERFSKSLFLFLLFLFVGFTLWTMLFRQDAPPAEETLEPVLVNMVPEKRVVIPAPRAVVKQEAVPLSTQQQARRAIQQNLGFLGLIGKKDLSKAIGGLPSDLAKNVSPGAGPGGTEGSGGELLTGLGQGVKRTTVGGSGVVGLGGVGTKGSGGGQGGYGNSLVGSGEGKGLSSIPLSQDMMLEGGLDRSVIQATIAKYLNQVRACYETGLRSNPGLEGQVAVAFEIGASGALDAARVSRSTLGQGEVPAGVESCITTKMMGWVFPKPLGGVKVKVNYPFLLRPVRS